MSALLTGLESYWALEEATGASRADSIGSNTLTDHASVVSGSGKVGNGANFTGTSSQYLSHASNSSLQAGNIDFTFGFWVIFTGAGAVADQVLVSKDVDSPANSRDYTIDAGGAAFRFYVNGGGGGLLVTGSAVVRNVWYYVVCWHDATADTLNIQVNNGTAASASTGGTAPQTSSAEFRLGARAYSGFEGYATATIDEVGYWKRTLTAQEKTDLYGAGSGLAFSSFTAAGDTNFGTRVRPPHPFVGPMALRQGWRPQPVQDFTRAPATDTEFGVGPSRIPSRWVGPPALRRAAAARTFYGDTSLAPAAAGNRVRRVICSAA